MAAHKSPQEYMIKAKLYRFVSMLFAVLGVVIFGVMYIKNIEGRFMEAIKDPMIILILVAPFLPAAFMAFLAGGAEKKFKKMKQSQETK